MTERIEETLRVLRASRKPFVTLPDVEDWRAQYATCLWRYRFPVLEGPSMVGKTQFARNLGSTPEAVYEIDCAGATEPDARDFVPGLHEVIIFDEASAVMVLRCKKLFQAGACWATLGQSATNCHSFRIWPHRTKMVVCSNRWWAELEWMQAADREWLVHNSVYVWVSDPLWVENEPGGVDQESQSDEPHAVTELV